MILLVWGAPASASSPQIGVFKLIMRRRLSHHWRGLATASAAGGRTFSGRTVVAATALGAVGSAVAVRQLMKVPTDPYAGRAEGSQARIAIEPQAERVVRVLYHDRSGVPKLARLDETAFSAEAERLATELEQARGPLLAGSSSTLHRMLDETFAECQGHDRVKAFADWYYAYATTYELMRVAVAAGAAAIPTNQSSHEAAAEAVASAVLEKYSAIVLRPAQTEPKLRVTFDKASSAARSDVLQAIGRVHERSLPLLEKHTTHLDARSTDTSTRLQVDWRFARGTAVGIDQAHGRPNAMPSVALLGGGALIGKAVASSAGKAAATAATKAMAGKLAAPFVAKIGSAMAPAAASVGAAAGGPVGVVVGAGIGLTIDYALAKGLELAGRAELERDVAFALRTAQGEWRYAMETELRRAVNALCDDAVQTTAAAYQTVESVAPSPLGAAATAAHAGPAVANGDVLPVTPLILPGDAMVPASLQPAPPPAVSGSSQGLEGAAQCVPS